MAVSKEENIIIIIIIIIILIIILHHFIQYVCHTGTTYIHTLPIEMQTIRARFARP